MFQLAASAAAAGIILDDSQVSRFRVYFNLLESASVLHNLTSVSGWEGIGEQLFLRSLRLGIALGHAKTGGQLVDVGTGAGIPGIPLKIAYPEMKIILIDSTLKKIEFANKAIDELELTDSVAIHSRAEEFGRDLRYREFSDVVVARSVGSLSELAELMLPLTVVGGKAIAIKTSPVDSEEIESRFSAHLMGSATAKVIEIKSPGSAPEDSLVVWDKIRPTPNKYPRRTGTPKRHPLRSPAGAKKSVEQN